MARRDRSPVDEASEIALKASLADTIGKLRRMQPAPFYRNPGAILEPDDYEHVSGLMQEIRTKRWEERIPRRFHDATLESAVHAAEAAKVAVWAANPQNTNLLIVGAVGRGKTYLGVAALRPLHFRGLEVTYLPALTMFDMLRPGGVDGALDAMCDTDVLMIDDLGKEKPTEWTGQVLYEIVNGRWLEDRPTIVTTGLNRTERQAHYDAATLSRLAQNCLTIVLQGQDLRS